MWKQWTSEHGLASPTEARLGPATRVLFDGRVDPMGAEQTARITGLEALDDAFLDFDSEDCAAAEEALHRLFLTRPWGALYRSLFRPWISNFARTIEEIEALLSHWALLETARYPWYGSRDESLEKLVGEHLGSTVNAWCPLEVGVLQKRLGAALAAMKASSRVEQEDAVLRQVRQLLPELIGESPGVKVFENEAFARSSVRRLDDAQWQRVACARPAEVSTFLMNEAYRMSQS